MKHDPPPPRAPPITNASTFSGGVIGVLVQKIMAAPPVPTLADYLALTRILLVSSVWGQPQEPPGRHATRFENVT